MKLRWSELSDIVAFRSNTLINSRNKAKQNIRFLQREWWRSMAHLFKTLYAFEKCILANI